MSTAAMLTVIADGWYTKTPFIKGLLNRKINYIGKIRRDARLYKPLIGSRKKKRGKPRKKGQRIYLKKIMRRKPDLSGIKVVIRGRKHQADIWSVRCVMALMTNRTIQCVIARWKLKSGSYKYINLLCTDLDMSPTEIIRYYDSRWMIEPCFCWLKQRGGFSDYSGLKSAAHIKWAQLCCVARSLLVLVKMKRQTAVIDPRRKSSETKYTTVGQKSLELTNNFHHFVSLVQNNNNSSNIGTTYFQRT